MSLPVVGARISLVSKSNIRFVGTLHSINHEESSVSLEQVYSFGTEGRAGRPDKEIPAQPQVFPLIVFKGTDVKDLKVEENPQMPPQYQQQQHQAYFQTNQAYFNPYQMQPQQQQPQSYWNQPPPSVSQGPPPGYGFGGPVQPSFQPGGFGSGGLGGSFGQPQQSYGSNNISMGSLNPNPSVIAPSRPPVRIEQPKPIQQQQHPIRAPALSAPASNKNVQEPSAPPPVNAAITFGKTGSTNNFNVAPAPGAPWKTGPSPSSSAVKKPEPVKSALQLNNENEPNSASTASPISPSSATTPQKVFQLKDIRSGRAKSDAVVVEKTFADFQDDEVEQPTRPRQNNNSRNGGNQGNNTRQPRQHDRGGERRPPRAKMVIPNEEFDFEQSNAKFARDAEDEEDEEQVEEASEPVFYKKSSFFDDISSDNKDRAAQNQETFDRRAKMSEDRKQNMETFGQAGIRRNGRGRGRGRGGGQRRVDGERVQ